MPPTHLHMAFKKSIACLLLSATAAQAGDVEWTRRRGGAPPRDQPAFAFAGRARLGNGLAARTLRRPRSSQAPSMQLNDVSLAGTSDSMEYRRRSVTRNLFGANSREMSGWMSTLRNLDGPEMPFDEMVETWNDTDKMMNVSKDSRQKRLSRYKHFDLRVRGVRWARDD